METKKLILTSPDAFTIFEKLKGRLKENSNEVEIVTFNRESVKVFIAVKEKYFLRTNSSASLTYSIFCEDNLIQAVVCASGAGAGWLNLSYGATSKLMKDAVRLLVDEGFKEQT
ncbi:hypothetical protein M2475_001223 [Breznakia sp. PF5-3]|uniref:DUF6054 family protein n=1 Tax=unclassified Breznakia TaxID=2623764 RepID=UPI002405E544|nr:MULTISPECIES: DUF6054 family protein [unclassified Breznakia]MDF9824669.1 hypothetical protein [Breznakia sp. PM6-1]MDF9835654.1 hypothetical protein [Breznakia sp. PF5-3]MDF9837681.1 hypothetical protein [Breznakia sp. PFB2-8]MDF9859545.1 hypothetical protein [Breznakia sp. PH5-24]